MALRLSSDRHDELLRARLAERLTPRQLRELWPDDPPDAPTTLAAVPPGLDGAVSAVLAAVPEPPGQPFGASNAWVVAGSRTASGKPILANDPHLGFTLPRAVVPGAPRHPEGRAGRRDIAGVSRRRPRPQRADRLGDHQLRHRCRRHLSSSVSTPPIPTATKRREGSRPFVARDEVIAVKGAPAETRTVRSTRHGPVISDLPGLAVSAPPSLSADAGVGQPVVAALAATYLGEDDRTADALIALNRASNWREFLAAAKETTAPQQNVFYADVDGHIGFISAGRIPLRPAGGGRMPVPGWTGAADWTGFVPFGRLAGGLRSAVRLSRQRQQPPRSARLSLADPGCLGCRLSRRANRGASRGRDAADRRRHGGAAARLGVADGATVAAVDAGRLPEPDAPPGGDRAAAELGWNDAARPAGAADLRRLASRIRARAGGGRARRRPSTSTGIIGRASSNPR